MLLLFLLTPLISPSLNAVAKKFLNFFTLAESDQRQVEITLPNPGGPPVTIQQDDLTLTVAEAQALAGFDLILPAALEDEFTFQGGWYSSLSQQVALFFQGNDRSMLVIQQPGGAAELP